MFLICLASRYTLYTSHVQTEIIIVITGVCCKIQILLENEQPYYKSFNCINPMVNTLWIVPYFGTNK